MRPAALVFGAVVALAGLVPARAEVVINADRGGMIGDYVARYQRVRQSGQHVVIDGLCLSACTLVVGIIPRSRVCATRNAVLGFHAAWMPDQSGRRVTSAVATQALWGLYPPGVRRWITRRGGLTPHMLLMQGRDLAAVVPSCDQQQAARGMRAGYESAAPYDATEPDWAQRRTPMRIAPPAAAEAPMAR